MYLCQSSITANPFLAVPEPFSGFYPPCSLPPTAASGTRNCIANHADPPDIAANDLEPVESLTLQPAQVVTTVWAVLCCDLRSSDGRSAVPVIHNLPLGHHVVSDSVHADRLSGTTPVRTHPICTQRMIETKDESERITTSRNTDCRRLTGHFVRDGGRTGNHRCGTVHGQQRQRCTLTDDVSRLCGRVAGRASAGDGRFRVSRNHSRERSDQANTDYLCDCDQ